MDNKLNNMIKEFMEKNNPKTIEEANQALQEFLKQYNAGELDYENTALDDAYEILEKAEKTKNKKQAIKLAKEAYQKCPECFDAILFQVNLEDNSLKRATLLNEGLEYEKERLEKEGLFAKENIGHFYGIFETRPYIRGLYLKATYLIIDGKLKKARSVCKEILKLNNNDNTGARYLLMAIYATLESEKDILNLYKKYPEENLEMLFPLFALYYKLEKYDQAQEYLDKLNKVNSNFIKLFNYEDLEDKKDTPPGYYSRGSMSEIIMYRTEYFFLIDTLTTIEDFIEEYSKKSK